MILKSLFLSLVWCLLLTGMAMAQSARDVVSLSVLPGARLEPNHHIAALQLRLKPGWKTYWRAPGEAGIPPSFNWSGSENLAAVNVLWPTPILFHQYGMRSIGYSGDVILPLEISPLVRGDQITLSGEINLGVCQDICIPLQARFKAVLPAQRGALDSRIEQAIRQQPKSPLSAKLRARRCDFAPVPDGLGLKVTLDMPPAGAPEQAAIETGNPLIWVAPPSAIRTGGILSLETVLTHIAGQPFAVQRDALRITVFGNKYAVDILGCSSN